MMEESMIQHFLDRLGMVAFLAGAVVWVFLSLVIAGPYVGRIFQSIVSTISARPLDDLRCPLVLSGSETKNITVVIGNPGSTARVYSVSARQMSLQESSGGIEICSQQVTVQPGQHGEASCPVSTEQLARA